MLISIRGKKKRKNIVGNHAEILRRFRDSEIGLRDRYNSGFMDQRTFDDRMIRLIINRDEYLASLTPKAPSEFVLETAEQRFNYNYKG